MGRISTVISKENASKYLESSQSLNETLKIKNDKLINSFTFSNICSRFTNKILEVLKKLLQSSEVGAYYFLDFLPKLNIRYLVLYNTESTASLFETFKKIGMPLTSLKIGFNGNTLYTNKNLLMTLTRMSEEFRKPILIYLLSIFTFFMNITPKYNPDIKNDTLRLSKEGNLEIDLDELQISRLFKTFEYSVNLEIDEIPSENLEKVDYCNSNLCKMVITPRASRYPLNYIIAKNSEGYKVFFKSELNSSVYGIFTPGNPNKLAISIDCCLIDVDTDGLVSQFLSNLDSGFVATVTPEQFKKALGGEVFEPICDKDSIEGEILKTFTTFLSNGNVSWSENLTEIKKSFKDLDIKFSKVKGAFDVDENLKMYKKDTIAQELYKQVQPYFKTFDLKDLTKLVPLFGVSNGLYSAMFIGESGTGKSTAARVLANRCGFPYVSINFSTNIEESDLIGTMIPNPAKKSTDDPEFIWKDGILTTAVRNGYTLILEELNLARPGVICKLNSLLDETRQIELPTGEIVRANPFFKIIATCNIGYEGTNRFNRALVNRFEQIHEFQDLDLEDTMSIVKTRLKYTDEEKITKVYEAYNAIKKFSKEQNIKTVISVRQILTMFKQGKYFKDAQEACISILVNGAFIEEPEYREQFITDVLPAIKLNFKI